MRNRGDDRDRETTTATSQSRTSASPFEHHDRLVQVSFEELNNAEAEIRADTAERLIDDLRDRGAPSSARRRLGELTSSARHQASQAATSHGQRERRAKALVREASSVL